MQKNKAVFLSSLLIAVSLFFVPFSNTHAASVTVTVTGSIQAVSGTTLPAVIAVKVNSTTYTVDVTSSTTLLRNNGASSALNEFVIGDSVQVKGTKPSSGATTIAAKTLRDLSNKRSLGTFTGKIKKASCSAKTITFITSANKTYTITTNASTKFFRSGIGISCTSLKNGEAAKIIGSINTAKKTIIADRVSVNAKIVVGTVTAVERTNNGLPAIYTIQLSNKQVWQITASKTTKFYFKKLHKAYAQEIGIGAKIEALGMTTSTHKLNALLIRDTSRTTLKSSAIVGSVKLKKWDSGFTVSSQLMKSATSLTASEIKSLTLAGWPQAPVLSNGYAYIAGGPAGLEVIDVRDPKKPVIAATLQTGDFAGYVYVSGSVAYVGSAATLYLVDIQNPGTPTILGSYAMIDTENTIRSVAVIGSYAYIANSTAEITVVDVHDSANPVYAGHYLDFYGTDFEVAAFKGYVYTLSPNGGITVLDVSTPATPTAISSYALITNPLNITFNDTYGFVRTTNGLEIFEPTSATNPNPTLIGLIPIIGKNEGWTTWHSATNSTLYTVQDDANCNTTPAPKCNFDIGAFSLKDPANPTMTAKIPAELFGSASGNNGYIRQVTSDGTYLYVVREANVRADGSVLAAGELFILRAP